jgi:hypothetical protein
MKPKLFDVVALLDDVSEKKLIKGQVGTLVEELEEGVFEVEFSDDNGITYALIPLPVERLLLLHYNSSMVA